jgi:hypothetical protein
MRWNWTVAEAREMNWRRGLFRAWLVGAVGFGVTVAALNYDQITNEFGQSKKASDWSSEVKPFDVSGPATPMVPTPCNKARGIKDVDYITFEGAPGCWFQMPVFRRLYPEYSDIEESVLFHRLYELVPGSLGPSGPRQATPWKSVAHLAGIAIGIPVAIMLAAIIGAWVLAGFKTRRT